MNAKEIYIIRHGETEFNKRGLVQGSSINSDLNQNGIAQANAFYQHYQDTPFDKIYVSKLNRTFQSVKDFVASGIPHQRLWGLNEISWGEKEGRPLTQKDDAKHYLMLKEWRRGNYRYKLKGGESPSEVWARQKVAIEYMLSNELEKKILICCHGRAMRIMLSGMLDIPLKEMDQFKHRNLCLYKLIYSQGKFNIALANDIRHLDSLELPELNSYFQNFS